jgi:hypothetical protein
MRIEMYSVYKHTCPNGKVYIGITSQEPKHRWNNGNGYRENEYFFRAIKKYGWNNIKHEILFENLSESDAELKEIELISQYNSQDRSCGYNRHAGGKITLQFSLESLLDEKYKSYDEIQKDRALRNVFDAVVKAALGHTYTETVVIYTYDENGKRVKQSEQVIEKTQKPSYFAICLLLEKYRDVEIVKPIAERLKALKEAIENE